ncbi:MAG TPA: hypothetical protein V6C89_08775 [Drouetiella sp.]|jgi:hypothetical protein
MATEAEVAKPQTAAPEKKAIASDNGSSDQTRTRLSLEANLAGPQAGADKVDDKTRVGAEPEKAPFGDVIKEMYGPRAGAARAAREVGAGNQDLTFDPIPGFDHARHDRPESLRLAAAQGDKPLAPGDKELAHGDRSRIIQEKNGAISDQGDLNGTHYDATASKDKDSIVWKDKDGKEHRFERTKGANRNEYVDGDGTTLVQNGDRNTITFKEGFQVDIDARTGRTIIQHNQQEIAQYNGKDAVRRQLDGNNVAFQVRGDVAATVDQIKEYQQRTGQPQNGNMIIKNEKGDTVVLQQDGTEITRKADSPTVTIKRGDTVVEYTPGQEAKVISGGDHIKQSKGSLQIDGHEMLNSDGSVTISGMKDGRLDSRFGRIYGTTDNGGQIDLGTGRAIADSLTTTNTGTGVEATTNNGTVILKTGPDSKQIQSGSVTTNVDQTNPTTTVKGTDGSNIVINNGDGSSRITDASGADIANINGAGDMCTWDGTNFGADGSIFNADMDLSGWTSFDEGGPSYFAGGSGSESGSGAEERNEVSAQVVSDTNNAVCTADAVCADATSLANNLDATPNTLGQIESGMVTLSASAAQIESLLAINPALVSQLGLINQSMARLDGVRGRVQSEVAVQDRLNGQYGVATKSLVATALELGGTQQAVDESAKYYQLAQAV